jgi:hypothetical protein
MRGNAVAEAVVSRVSKGDLSVESLSNLIEDCVEAGEFSLLRQGNLHGKHVEDNYKSAIEARSEVTKALVKRCERGQTAGPFVCDAHDLPFADYACNPIGAVAKRNSTDMRPVDDTVANADIKPPTFGMIAIAWLREMASHMCWWWVVDIEDAFANLPIGPTDRPWMMFRWYHTDDTEFRGTCHDAIYMHVKGNFGPRPLPYWYTMYQLYINIAFMAVAGVMYPPMGFIDDNSHQSASQQEGLGIMQLYKQHLRKAGIKDKESKEQLPFQIGIILGRIFNSISMTISITSDKLQDLTHMLHSCVGKRVRKCLKDMECLLGLWEFCLECMPHVTRSFAHNTHAWLKKLRNLKSHPKALHWFPTKCRKDMEIMLAILPMCNGTQPLQPFHQKHWQRPVMTDASPAGGGYVSPTQCYARKFTCREKRACIAVLEGKMVQEAVDHNADEWHGCVVPVYIDNTTALHCFKKGRSRNRLLNGIIRATMFTCAQHDIILVFQWVPTKANLLADALSRGWWREFFLGLTYFVWPDTGLPLLASERASMKQHLPQHLNDLREEFAAKAYAPGSQETWASGWKAWVEFCHEAEVLPMGIYTEEDLNVLYATFRAALTSGRYGRWEVKMTNTVESYLGAVRHKRDEHFKVNEDERVKRGIQRVKGKDTKPKKSVTLQIACDLNTNASVDNLEQLRNCTIYVQLGQGTSRSQTAVVSRTAMMEDGWMKNKVLMVSDVVIDWQSYGVRYGLRQVEKQDHGGALRGDDGYEWIYVAGKRNSVLDAVAITDSYIRKMRFSDLSLEDKAVTPFYQIILDNRPTGKVLTYDSLLRSFRRDLKKLPKELYPFEDWDLYGLHSWRRFGATIAHCNGVPHDMIQELGRWCSDSFLSCFVLSHEEGFARQSRMLAEGRVVQGSDGVLRMGPAVAEDHPGSRAQGASDGGLVGRVRLGGESEDLGGRAPRSASPGAPRGQPGGRGEGKLAAVNRAAQCRDMAAPRNVAAVAAAPGRGRGGKPAGRPRGRPRKEAQPTAAQRPRVRGASPGGGGARPSGTRVPSGAPGSAPVPQQSARPGAVGPVRLGGRQVVRGVATTRGGRGRGRGRTVTCWDGMA